MWWQAPSDAHHSVIQQLLTPIPMHPGLMFLLIHFEIQELWVIITTNTRTQPENFQEILQISRRFPGFPGVLDIPVIIACKHNSNLRQQAVITLGFIKWVNATDKLFQVHWAFHRPWVTTKYEKKVPRVFQAFPEPQSILFNRLSQQNVNVMMTFIHQGSFQINSSNITCH